LKCVAKFKSFDTLNLSHRTAVVAGSRRCSAVIVPKLWRDYRGRSRKFARCEVAGYDRFKTSESNAIGL
jgi:hypothetical protein